MCRLVLDQGEFDHVVLIDSVQCHTYIVSVHFTVSISHSVLLGFYRRSSTFQLVSTRKIALKLTAFRPFCR